MKNKYLDIISKKLKIRKTLKAARRWFLSQRQKRYLHIQLYEAVICDIPIRFSTEDVYSNTWFYPRYLNGKVHEQPVTEFLLSILENAKCFVDIGTNLGWYTCLASKKLKHGVVYGFEMDHLNYELLRKNIALNDCTNVTAFNTAVSSENGILQYMQYGNSPSPSFRPMSKNESAHLSASATSVPAVTIDSFFNDKDVKPDVLKIDVEGAELQVLHGMQETLEKYHPVLFIEIHPSNLAAFNVGTEDILAFLHKYQYEIYEIPDIRSFHSSGQLHKIETPDEITNNTMLYSIGR